MLTHAAATTTIKMVARDIPLQHMGNLADKIQGKKIHPPPLQPNQVQLYSFYKPGLVAGSYKIEAEQNIRSEGPHQVETLRLYNRKLVKPEPVKPTDIEPQHFEVITPQFSLDPKLIDSFVSYCSTSFGLINSGKRVLEIFFKQAKLTPNPTVSPFRTPR